MKSTCTLLYRLRLGLVSRRNTYTRATAATGIQVLPGAGTAARSLQISWIGCLMPPPPLSSSVAATAVLPTGSATVPLRMPILPLAPGSFGPSPADRARATRSRWGDSAPHHHRSGALPRARIHGNQADGAVSFCAWAAGMAAASASAQAGRQPTTIPGALVAQALRAKGRWSDGSLRQVFSCLSLMHRDQSRL